MPLDSTKPDEQQQLAELERLLALLPGRIRDAIERYGNMARLIEIVMDLGRPAELRYQKGQYVSLDGDNVSREELDYLCDNVGGFTSENRAGIEETLHRISAIRNVKGDIVGLTCRVGKAVTGTVDLLEDLLETGQSILLLGPPGSGKTTRLREMAQICADRMGKRVIIVDTASEIGGGGDIPHPSIGRSRRMQVPDPNQQHRVMIEAVENHTPHVIVIDEIGSAEEAEAARTIAERGVMLIATAHGNNLDGLMKNPPLAPLIGEPHSVTLSDEEAKRRQTQKSILERKQPATFEILIELVSYEAVIVHHDVNQSVDALLHGMPPISELRQSQNLPQLPDRHGEVARIYPYAISHGALREAMTNLDIPAILVNDPEQATYILALRGYNKALRHAQDLNLPISWANSNDYEELEMALSELFEDDDDSTGEDTDMEREPNLEMRIALNEASEAIQTLQNHGQPVELRPRKADIRRAQQRLVASHGLLCDVVGQGKEQRLRIEAP